MAFTFKSVADKMPIGTSIFDKEGAKLVPELLTKAKEKGVKMHFPTDFRIGEKFDKSDQLSLRLSPRGCYPPCSRFPLCRR